MAIFRFVLIVPLLLIVSSCTIQKAKPNIKQSIIIASDCLYLKDTLLFRQFIKNSNIKVYIQHLPVESIIQKIEDENQNTHFDMVLLKSVSDIYFLEKKQFLQPLPITVIPIKLLAKFYSKSNKWLPFGIFRSDSLTTIDSCTPLFKKENWQFCFKKSFGSFQEINRKEIQSSSAKYKKPGRSAQKNDSSSLDKTVILSIDTSAQKENHQTNSFGGNGLKIEPTYDMSCLGVVKQARNYANSLQLIKAIFTIPLNKELNKRLKTKSVFNYLNKRIKLESKLKSGK